MVFYFYDIYEFTDSLGGVLDHLKVLFYHELAKI